MGAIRLGYLVDPPQSAEQRAAYEWLVAHPQFDTEVVDSSSLEGVSFGQFDVIWWHRDESIPERLLDRIVEPLADFVGRGGGLLLSLYGLTAVDALGVDEITPDHRRAAGRSGRSGFLMKTIYEEHPIFEGLDGLHVPTQSAETDAPGVNYRKRIPRRGELLAASIEDGDERQNDFSLAVWRQSDGTVVGAGEHLTFDESWSAAAADNRDTLTENICTFLAHGASPGPALGTPTSTAGFDRLRAAVADDRHRPRYHFTPPANWLNDPNGLLQYDGTYHLFYQYNPAGPVHGSIHWGHATSTDLIHWDDQPVALMPSKDGPDWCGCYSGSAVRGEEGPVAMYTGITATNQSVCLAKAAGSDIAQWKKSPRNPVIEGPPDDFDVRSTDRVAQEYDFRDPSLWHEDGKWYILIGTGTTTGEGRVLLYKSENLVDWNSLGPLTVDGAEDTGAMWECPEWFPLEERDLLHVSDYSHRAVDRAGVPYFLGDFDLDAAKFTVTASGWLDGGRFYAPQSFQDDDERRMIFGWLPESRTASKRWEAGWGGVMSLPRVVSLTDGGERLTVRPASAVRELRDRHRSFEEIPLENGVDRLNVGGRRLELSATFSLHGASEVGLVVRRSPNGEEQTVIRYRPDPGMVVLDRSESSLETEDHREALEEMSVDVASDDDITLRIFVDHSVVETFVNDRTAITGRVYPTRRDSLGIAAYADGDARLDLDAWTLKPAFDV